MVILSFVCPRDMIFNGGADIVVVDIHDRTHQHLMQHEYKD